MNDKMKEKVQHHYFSDDDIHKLENLQDKQIKQQLEAGTDSIGKTLSASDEEGRSPSMREELKEEEAMGNDVEKMHSEGDEPDLDEFLKHKNASLNSAADGSLTGAMSSETGKPDLRPDTPYKRGNSSHAHYS